MVCEFVLDLDGSYGRVCGFLSSRSNPLESRRVILLLLLDLEWPPFYDIYGSSSYDCVARLRQRWHERSLGLFEIRVLLATPLFEECVYACVQVDSQPSRQVVE